MIYCSDLLCQKSRCGLKGGPFWFSLSLQCSVGWHSSNDVITTGKCHSQAMTRLDLTWLQKKKKRYWWYYDAYQCCVIHIAVLIVSIKKSWLWGQESKPELLSLSALSPTKMDFACYPGTSANMKYVSLYFSRIAFLPGHLTALAVLVNAHKYYTLICLSLLYSH